MTGLQDDIVFLPFLPRNLMHTADLCSSAKMNSAMQTNARKVRLMKHTRTHTQTHLHVLHAPVLSGLSSLLIFRWGAFWKSTAPSDQTYCTPISLWHSTFWSPLSPLGFRESDMHGIDETCNYFALKKKVKFLFP